MMSHHASNPRYESGLLGALAPKFQWMDKLLFIHATTTIDFQYELKM
jgi:hypothetical protein